MDILHHRDDVGGSFHYDEDGASLGELTYRRAGEKIVIQHTGVDKKLEGKGVGKKLVAEAVKFAREANLKVGATCPFAKHVLESSSEYGDVFVRG